MATLSTSPPTATYAGSLQTRLEGLHTFSMPDDGLWVFTTAQVSRKGDSHMCPFLEQVSKGQARSLHR